MIVLAWYVTCGNHILTSQLIWLQAKRLLSHYHCYAVDLRGAGDSTLSIPEGAVHKALNNEEDPEWMKPSSRLPTFEGHAEDICAIADHFSWHGKPIPSEYWWVALHAWNTFPWSIRWWTHSHSRTRPSPVIWIFHCLPRFIGSAFCIITLTAFKLYRFGLLAALRATSNTSIKADCIDEEGDSALIQSQKYGAKMSTLHPAFTGTKLSIILTHTPLTVPNISCRVLHVWA